MLSKNEAQALIQSVEQLRKNHPEKSFDPAEINGLRRDMAILEDAVKRRNEKDFLIEVYQAVIKRANMRVHPFFFEPMFEKALSRRDVTAWICENDIVAFAAISFLNKRNIEIPRDISVAGFDNLPMETLEYRLTSFDFNAPGFMYRMVDFILRPSRAFAHYRHFPIEIEGIIMDRETTGRARTKEKAG
jgi:DNA-binding LacI/PurR family transcriptional regulator